MLVEQYDVEMCWIEKLVYEGVVVVIGVVMQDDDGYVLWIVVLFKIDDMFIVYVDVVLVEGVD